ncbi:hypothetical protein ALP24_04919, partial [Pseudomonas syringae pv. aptata]
GNVLNGLYTPDVPSTDRFVLIFVEAPHSILGIIEGHIILPLPLDRFAGDLELMKDKKVQTS